MKEIEDTVRSVIGAVLSIAPETLSDADSLSQGTWNSLNHMNVLFALSEHFRFEVTPEAVQNMTSIKAIVIYLRENIES